MNLSAGFKKFVSKVPVANSVCYFPGKVHSQAWKKFLVLWLGATAPVILSVLLSDWGGQDESILEGVLRLIGNNVSPSELFVYCASFVTPILYIIVERYFQIEGEDKFSDKIKEAVKVFDGYWLHCLISGVVLILTAIGYSFSKTAGAGFSNTLLSFLLNKGAFFIYLYSLLCMYLVILDGLLSGSGDFVRSNRQDEHELADDFKSRISKRLKDGGQ